MPFPMVHFYVAHDPVIIKKATDFSQFYLGILAPDAYRSRIDYTLADRGASHLAADDIEHWQKNILDFYEKFKYGNQKCFCLGYCIHILTDIYWDSMIFQPFLAALSKDEKASSLNQRQAYMSDMTMIDLYLYRNCGFKKDLWDYLVHGESFDVLGLVTAAEINAERDLTLVWYDRKKDHPVDGLKYITIDQVMDFLDNSANEISRRI